MNGWLTTNNNFLEDQGTIDILSQPYPPRPSIQHNMAFKQRRRQRPRQRHKTRILLVKKEKIHHFRILTAGLDLAWNGG